MKILLMRHCLAATVAESGVSYDAERPLTSEGKAHAEAAAQFLKKNSLVPTLILCSPFLRASTTAEIISETIGGIPIQPSTSILPGAGTDDLLGVVSKNITTEDEWTLVIVHEPDTGHLLGRFLLGEERYPVEILPGNIYALDVYIENEHARARVISSFSPLNSSRL